MPAGDPSSEELLLRIYLGAVRDLPNRSCLLQLRQASYLYARHPAGGAPMCQASVKRLCPDGSLVLPTDCEDQPGSVECRDAVQVARSGVEPSQTLGGTV